MKQTEFFKSWKGTTLLIILCLILGLFAGATLFSTHDTKTVTNDVIKEVPVNQTVFVNQTVEVPINYLGNAESVFLQAVKNGEDPAGNLNNVLGNYNYDEVSVHKIYNAYTVTYLNSDKYTVEFSISLRFKQSDLAAETHDYDVTVTYQDGEKTIVEIH